MSVILLVVALCVVLYVYIVYPVVLSVVNKFCFNRSPVYSDYFPSVCIVIAAYNEENYVSDKISNSLNLDYPQDKLKVILVSDGSDDNTLALAKSVEAANLKVIEVKERQGKANALNTALEHVTEEVIVFTDANVFLSDNALKELVKPLQDNDIGCVSGQVVLKAMSDSEILGEGMYMKYERLMFSCESQISTMTGIDGGMFAIKKEYVEPIPVNTILDDMLIAMRVLLRKKKIKYNANAIAEEYVPASVAQEFKRKVRIATGAFQLLPQVTALLNPLHNLPMFIFFVSHKVFRWLSPVFLMTIFVATAVNLDKQPFEILFYLQVVFYFIALLGQLSTKLRNVSVVYIAYYFTVVNISMFIGLFKYLFGNHSVKWKKVNR